MQNTCMNNNGLASERTGESRQQQSLDQQGVAVPTYFAQRAPVARLLGAGLLVVFSPAILLSAVLVRLTSPGPALFRQKRLGKGNREFFVLKLRTMRVDAEQKSGPALCQPGDSRITPAGRLLRFLHLDELPQLLNVVRGEMCLVGPRPERPEIIECHQLNERVPGFAERTQVLPGITGLAQINLPADVTADCVIPKVKLDLEYIETANFGLDLRILLCTTMRMMGVRHGYAVKLLGLCRKVSLGQELPPKKFFGKLRPSRTDATNKPEPLLNEKQPVLTVAAMAAHGGPVDPNRLTDIRVDDSHEAPLPRHPR